jgi:excinuclease ABC subunit C
LLIPPDPLLIDPQSPDLQRQLDTLPRRTGIFVLEAAGHEPYLSWSAYLQKRLKRLLLHTDTGRLEPLSKLRKSVDSVACWPTQSRLETWLVLYSLARRYYPTEYKQRLKLRRPWFLSLLTADEFPRLRLASRIARPPALTLGPFRTRELAEAFEQATQGLFQLRRCEEKLEPHADHPGCIYGEMNLCLRPCQLAVTPAEYASETHRVANFFESEGSSLLTPLLSARDRASQEMDFEQAARLHRQIDKVKAVAAARDALVRPVDELNGLAVTRGLGERAIKLWPMLGGYWQRPLFFDFSEGLSESKSMDHILRETLSTHLSNPVLEGSRVEELGLLSRWYYSSWRDGAWVQFQDLAKLNYRRLVKEISLLLKPA